jgi:hypothetical protein
MEDWREKKEWEREEVADRYRNAHMILRKERGER